MDFYRFAEKSAPTAKRSTTAYITKNYDVYYTVSVERMRRRSRQECCHAEARSAEASPDKYQNLGKSLYHHSGILKEMDFYRADTLKSHFASFRMTGKGKGTLKNSESALIRAGKIVKNR